MNPPIPKNSRDAWQAHKPNRPQNPGLIFDRFVDDWGNSTAKEAKRLAFAPVVKAANEQADKELLREWNTRWEKSVQAAHAKVFSLTTDWRLVAGLGRKGPLEAGFTFHRYGFPVLPGSSVKGVARAWAFWLVAEKLGGVAGEALERLDQTLTETEPENLEKALREFSPSPEARALVGQFRAVFGTPGQAGQALFFEAIPARVPTLELDIMNPHYPNYYQGSLPPTDGQNPNPVSFLAVAAGQSFRFAVGWQGKPDGNLQGQAALWLELGLAELGAGGKTSAGYGYFHRLENQPALPAAAVAPTAEARLSVATVALKDLAWQKGRVSKDGRFILPADNSEQKLVFRHEHVLPRGYTPPHKAEVEFAIETLPNGEKRVWVRALYYPVA